MAWAVAGLVYPSRPVVRPDSSSIILPMLCAAKQGARSLDSNKPQRLARVGYAAVTHNPRQRQSADGQRGQIGVMSSAHGPIYPIGGRESRQHQAMVLCSPCYSNRIPNWNG